SDPGVRALTRRRLAQTLEAARVIRPKTVVCHAGFEDRRHDYCRVRWLEASLKTWSWFARELAGLGSRLMLENVWERTPDELLALARGLSGLGAGICFDLGHHAVFGRGPARDWITALGPHINQLHLHDNFGIEDQHLALGRGNIDWKPLFEQLSRLAEPLAVTLEVQVGPDLDQSLDRLRALWPW
ncbi:MAG: TIM barrel protein, partial [Desulfovibrionaceae bacterium]|nr:TIM barrel protein [Desulfovibrionaceae bacterium]